MHDIQIELLDPSYVDHLASVKSLGVKNTKTLGLFPAAAFDDYARRKRILIALTRLGACAGYVLFSTTNDRATIFHLCVDDSQQGKGIARLLINALAARTRHLNGLALKCRRDYAANEMWPKLGFQALKLEPGRSKLGLPLVTWWRSNNGLDLFSYKGKRLTDVCLPVAIDTNIVFDFQGRKTLKDATSLALRADWLRDEIEFWVTPEASNEAAKKRDAKEAHKSVRFVQKFPCVACDPEVFHKICQELIPFFGDIKNENDKADLRHVAWTIAAGFHYFVTRDSDLCSRADSIANAFKLQILQPVELIVQFDELRRAEAYQPASLVATELAVRRIKPGNGVALAREFQNHRDGESQAEFLAKLNSYLALPEESDAFMISQKEDPLALYVRTIEPSDSNALTVPLFRAALSSAGSALAQHVAQQLVHDTIATGRMITSVTDQSASDSAIRALRKAGFFQTDTCWKKISIPRVERAAKIADVIRSLGFSSLGKEGEGILEWADLIAADPTVDNEQLLWPAKFTDLDLPSYIIPIAPRWASELFDANLARQNLFKRETSIAINTEAVYYRSCQGCVLKSPARVLWYVSHDDGVPGSKHLRACSYLEEVVVGKPKELFRRFRRLGVYKWDDLYATAKHDVDTEIMAIRIARTELFNKPIPIHVLRDKLKRQGINNTMVGPMRIESDLFLELYSVAVR